MTRFTLPLWFILALACMVAVRINRPMGKSLNWMPVAAVLYIVVFTIPSHAGGRSIALMEYGYGCDKAVAWIKKHDDGKTLYVAESSIMLVAEGIPSTRLILIAKKPLEYARFIKSGMFQKMMLITITNTDFRDGKTHIHEPSWQKTAGQWNTQVIWSHELTLGRRIQIEEVKGVTVDGVFHDFSVKDSSPSGSKSFPEMQEKMIRMIPTLDQE